MYEIVCYKCIVYMFVYYSNLLCIGYVCIHVWVAHLFTVQYVYMYDFLRIGSDSDIVITVFICEPVMVATIKLSKRRLQFNHYEPWFTSFLSSIYQVNHDRNHKFWNIASTERYILHERVLLERRHNHQTVNDLVKAHR